MASSKIDEALSALDSRAGVNGEGEVRYFNCAETLFDGERVPAPLSRLASR